LPDEDSVTVKWAGLLHDIGRVGISAGIWGKPGPLSTREWERVRMHPYYTQRVLARPGILARLGAVASLHHERLDGEVVNHVLAAAGHKVRPIRRSLIAGLSQREIEVLRLLARGNSKKQVAERLFISEKTVSHHTQHIYPKIGVSTRAGAAIFAMEHDLLADD